MHRQESWSGLTLSMSSSSSHSDTPGQSPADSHHSPHRQRRAERRKDKSRGEGSGRKKVAKACLACQRSHLTCDEQRPCTRCVKKGIGNECVEGVRKKAKYLLEGEERAAAQTKHSPVHSSIPPPVLDSSPVGPSRVPHNVWLNPSLIDNNTLENRFWADLTPSAPPPPAPAPNFNGTAAANEFEMLDSMFTSMDPVFPPLELDNMPFMETSTPTTSQPMLVSPWPVQSPEKQTKDENFADNRWWKGQHENGKSDIDTPGALEGFKRPVTSNEVYNNVTKPYDYTEGYHILMEYLAKNFEQRDVFRVVKALASYRPSLIALQMPMSEEDEIFLEKSFQRTLIELEKLISYSATPTAVWRRTGEVCYANPEFCRMVERDNELFNGRTYIYTIFAKPSVVEYFESFAVHAFENTTQNFFQQVSLVVGGRQVGCTCCLTIRRDVFDLPSVVIGQFLPIPSDA
ncbi:hypothetical protein TREMEDRAFT_71132 [Tremella mesenterica DSM 1558]|uniref:uncharacterized protein n=1 Tax=Tremella mesenterica (strain ATCC 24925 / CBS 8224 / DSM 1558 / NBRC 9311 / NRRL Y-6157 / RJB 2259-6 / UBC 559-6) TaxID=578456 RepID=UPI0003F496C7|nr:uncharacterized protein TREMEDRAFT_71132 [Tremella mesenterica DSM 1558]EIW71326.1 hypothetical protein TREMEDRAFT_71132 [Tremella mesenterica DSM 1558]